MTKKTLPPSLTVCLSVEMRDLRYEDSWINTKATWTFSRTYTQVLGKTLLEKVGREGEERKGKEKEKGRREEEEKKKKKKERRKKEEEKKREERKKKKKKERRKKSRLRERD